MCGCRGAQMNERAEMRGRTPECTAARMHRWMGAWPWGHACTDGRVRGRGGVGNTGKRVHVWVGVWKEGENERRAEK